MTPLEVGREAPDFTLRDQHGQEVRLSSFRGEKAVLLVFFPYAFSGVCTGELTVLRDTLERFETDDTTVLAISCDPVYTLRAVADRDGLFFPLLSDFWPHGAATAAYGVLDETQGCPERSSYVVDKAGVVRWSVHNDRVEPRDFDAQATHLAQAV